MESDDSDDFLDPGPGPSRQLRSKQKKRDVSKRGERSVNRSKSEDSNESEQAKIEKKKEAARLKKQRQRAKSSDEQKLAVREASKIHMRKKREGFTQEEKE